MPEAIRAITRLQDADDLNVSLAEGVDEYALCYDHDTQKFVLRQVTIGACLLATGATPGATSQAQAFTNGVKAGLLFPAADSTDAVKICKANGSTAIITIDTTNGRMSIGGSPLGYPLDIQHPTYAQVMVVGGTAGDFMLRHTEAAVDKKNWMLRCKDGYGEVSSQKDTGTYQIQGILKWDNYTGYVGLGMGAGAPGTRLDVNHSAAITNTVETIVTLRHASSGAPAGGFGAALRFGLESSTTENQSAALIEALWYEATHATRKANLVLSAYDTEKREGIRISGNGSAAAIGFLGATPAARIDHVADAVTAHDITDPGDAPADADALREDLVTNVIPSIESALNGLGTKINSLLTMAETFGFHATS